jgi:hypothetical protein
LKRTIIKKTVLQVQDKIRFARSKGSADRLQWLYPESAGVLTVGLY